MDRCGHNVFGYECNRKMNSGNVYQIRPFVYFVLEALRELYNNKISAIEWKEFIHRYKFNPPSTVSASIRILKKLGLVDVAFVKRNDRIETIKIIEVKDYIVVRVFPRYVLIFTNGVRKD